MPLLKREELKKLLHNRQFLITMFLENHEFLLRVDAKLHIYLIFTIFLLNLLVNDVESAAMYINMKILETQCKYVYKKFGTNAE